MADTIEIKVSEELNLIVRAARKAVDDARVNGVNNGLKMAAKWLEVSHPDAARALREDMRLE